MAATLIVAPSRQAARIVSERTEDPRLIRVFPRLVDTRSYAPPTVEVDLGDTHTVAFLGGREGGARTAMLTTTLKLLGARAPEARFLLVGTPGRADADLRDMLQTRDLRERTTFVDIGTPHELQQAVCGADVAVVIADPAALSLPHRALEAMACGLPVVATAVGGVAESIVPDRSGLLVRQRDPEAMAAAIIELADRSDEWSAMGRIGRRHVEQRFDLEALNDGLVEIYRQVGAAPPY